MRVLICFMVMLALCLMVLSAQESYSATAADFVAPSRADSIASPLTFRTIQTSMEAVDPANQYRLRAGMDSYIGSGLTIIDLPVSYAVNPDLQAQINIPLVAVGSAMETGLGDVRLSVKYRMDIDEFIETYFILAAKLPSGDPDKGLGTGAYDYSFTHKSVVTHGNYRTTLMAGITIPPPNTITVLGSKVEYGPTVSYMVATERALASTRFRLAIKAAGLHAFNSRINSEYQQNSLTTLDVIPEVSWRFSEKGSLRGGIVLPLITVYDLPGAVNRRDPTVNIGVFMLF